MPSLALLTQLSLQSDCCVCKGLQTVGIGMQAKGFRQCGCVTLKSALTSAPLRVGTDAAVTSAWVIAALMACSGGGFICSVLDMSNAGALRNECCICLHLVNKARMS